MPKRLHTLSKCGVCSRPTCNTSSSEEAPNTSIRPSQPVDAAINNVLYGLQQEFAALRKQSQELEAKIQSFDPAFNKKLRKQWFAQLSQLLKDMDFKAEQIYNLKDVEMYSV